MSAIVMYVRRVVFIYFYFLAKKFYCYPNFFAVVKTYFGFIES